MSIPDYVKRRADFCRSCSHAQRKQVGKQFGVTNHSLCNKSRRKIGDALPDADYVCPIGNFGRAITDGKSGVWVGPNQYDVVLTRSAVSIGNKQKGCCIGQRATG